MRKKLEEAGVKAECFSRGLIATPGRKVPETALKVAREFDIDMGPHVSQPLLAPDMDRAALMFVMEPEQRQYLSRHRPAYMSKVMLLSQPGGGGIIVDPMGRSEETFRQVYSEIVTYVDAWVARFGVVRNA